MNLLKIYKSNEPGYFTKHSNKIIESIIKLITLEINAHENEWLQTSKAIFDYHSEFNIKMSFSDDIISHVINLGNFGKVAKSRKFSVYFSANIIRVSSESNIELENRLLRSCQDGELIVKLEISKCFRFLIDHFDSKFYNDKILPFVNTFLEEKEIEILLHTFSASIHLGIEKTAAKMISIIRERIIVYQLLQLFTKQFVDIITSSKFTSKRKELSEALLDKYFYFDYNGNSEDILSKGESSEKESENFQKTSLILKNFSDIFIALEETEAYKAVSYFVGKNLYFVRNDTNNLTTSKSEFEYLELFLQNIDKLISRLTITHTNKLIMAKFVILWTNCPDRNIFRLIIANLKSLLINLEDTQNEEFLQLFNSNFDTFNKIYDDIFNWRVVVNAVEALQSIEIIYNIEGFIDKVFGLIKTLIANDKSNFEIQKGCVKLLVHLIMVGSSTHRKDYIAYIEKITMNTPYYTQRLYFVFVEHLIPSASYIYFRKQNQTANIKYILHNGCEQSKIDCISIIKRIYPFIENDKNLKNDIETELQNISKKCNYKMISEINEFRDFVKDFVRIDSDLILNKDNEKFKEVDQMFASRDSFFDKCKFNTKKSGNLDKYRINLFSDDSNFKSSANKKEIYSQKVKIENQKNFNKKKNSKTDVEVAKTNIVMFLTSPDRKSLKKIENSKRGKTPTETKPRGESDNMIIDIIQKNKHSFTSPIKRKETYK